MEFGKGENSPYESSPERFAVSDALSVSFKKIQKPEEDGELSLSLMMHIKTPEGVVDFPYTDVLPEGTMVDVRDVDVPIFNYDYKTRTLTLTGAWFRKDSEAAFWMTMHEGGHAVDAIRKPELYLKSDFEVSDKEFASTERGADEGMKEILANIKSRYGDHKIPEANVEQVIVKHLLNYQVGRVFETGVTEQPVFLHMRYISKAWEQRKEILEETIKELDVRVTPKIRELHESLNTKEHGGDVVRSEFMNVFGEFPYLSFALSRHPYFFEDLKGALDNSEFMGGGFSVFERKIKETLLDSKIGIAPFVAHEKLLVEESKEVVKSAR